jgi:hypothetical protein
MTLVVTFCHLFQGCVSITSSKPKGSFNIKSICTELINSYKHKSSTRQLMDLHIYCIEIEETIKFTSHMCHEPKAYYSRNTHILLYWYHLIYILSIHSVFHLLSFQMLIFPNEMCLCRAQRSRRADLEGNYIAGSLIQTSTFFKRAHIPTSSQSSQCQCWSGIDYRL